MIFHWSRQSLRKSCQILGKSKHQRHIRSEKDMKKNQKIKVIVIIVCCVAVDIFMHIVTGRSARCPVIRTSVLRQGSWEKRSQHLFGLCWLFPVFIVYLGSRNEIPGKAWGKWSVTACNSHTLDNGNA
jgi:hypothetical protein